MPKTLTQIVYVVIMIVGSTLLSNAQCLTPPPLDSCNGTEPSLSDHETLNRGIKKWYYGPATTFNDLTLNGGTLVVCSDLTIDKFYIDSGTIIVRPGARFVIGGGIGFGVSFRGNCAIYNWGRTEIIRNLSLEGNYASASKPNVVMNVTPGSVFKMSNQYFVINNPYSFFINNGKSDFHGIIIDPGAASGAVCMGNGSETKMTVLYNRKANSYTVPSGFACLNVTEYSQFYDSLTRSPTLSVCLGPRHYSDSSCRPWGCKPNAWGQASLFRRCNMCVDVQSLTVTITNFAITETPEEKKLYWWASINRGAEVDFYIERSHDGKLFARIDSLPVNNLYQNTQFSRSDRSPLPGYSYYRVVAVNRFSGHRVTSNTIKSFGSSSNKLLVYPNPFKLGITVTFKKDEHPLKLELYSMQGKLIQVIPPAVADAKSMQINLPASCAAGNYLLKIVYKDRTETVKISKQE